MCLCANACGMYVVVVFVRERCVPLGQSGGGGGGREAMEGVRKIYNAPTLCVPASPLPPPPHRPIDMPATPLSSHVGCRLLGTPARLPVRVMKGWRRR